MVIDKTEDEDVQFKVEMSCLIEMFDRSLPVTLNVCSGGFMISMRDLDLLSIGLSRSDRAISTIF